MSYRIAILPYLNMRPLVRYGAPAGCEFVFLPPRQAVTAIADGRVVAGPASVSAIAALQDSVAYLGRYGIACDGAVRSVLFFSRRPFSSFGPDFRIKLSTESLTSVGLLYLLFGHELGFEQLPKLAATGVRPDGELLIGDAALRRLETGTDQFITDLPAQWRRIHGLPFVFARWVVRKDTPPSIRDTLARWLAAVTACEDTRSGAARLDGPVTGLAPNEAMAYLRALRYNIGAREQRGQELFLSELKRRTNGRHHPPFRFQL